jgi:hypothetical protein
MISMNPMKMNDDIPDMWISCVFVGIYLDSGSRPNRHLQRLAFLAKIGYIV